MEIRASRTAKGGGRLCSDILVSSMRRRRRRRQPTWARERAVPETYKSVRKSYVSPHKVKNKILSFRYRVDPGKRSALNLTSVF